MKPFVLEVFTNKKYESKSFTLSEADVQAIKILHTLGRIVEIRVNPTDRHLDCPCLDGNEIIDDGRKMTAKNENVYYVFNL